MKLIWCTKCQTLISLSSKKVRYCQCKRCAGKYLRDEVTAVVNKYPVIVGIDNYTFLPAVYQAIEFKDKEYCVFYFTGWTPNKPGRVIRVKTKKEVEEYGKRKRKR